MLTRSALMCMVLWLVTASPARAAMFSEIEYGGPAGNAIEVTGLGPTIDYTLLILDANPYTPSQFGTVLGVIHLPAGFASFQGNDDTAMVSEDPWPNNTQTTYPIATLPTNPSDEIDLRFNRLLVLMQGTSAAEYLDRPQSDPIALADYNSATVIDWLVMGSGDLSTLYQTRGHNIAQINAQLNIDLLARLVDRDAGAVIGRAALPGQAIDPQVFYVGTPDPQTSEFLVEAGQYRYTYTPGQANAQLMPVQSAMPGDSDGDGDIDDADLGVGFSNYTGPVGAQGAKLASNGDTDNDGDVDDADLAVSFSTYTGPLAPASTVPEPACLFAFTIVLARVAARRR